jgi:hypothetical protein
LDAKREAGVYDETRRTFLPFSFILNHSESPGDAVGPVWVSDEETAFPAHSARFQPSLLDHLQVPQRLKEFWKKDFADTESSATVLYSTPQDAADSSEFDAEKLLLGNAKTGVTQEFARGYLADLELSSDT